MIELLLKLAAAYLLGGVMGGDVMRTLLGGGDLREAGSGNVGATNALRTRGPRFALGVLLIDVSKGVIAALLIPRIPWPWGAPAFPLIEQCYLCATAAAIGHCYPLFHRFRGGKGVATVAGIFGALFPPALPLMLAVFALLVMATGFVAIASIAGALTGVAYVAAAVPQPFAPAMSFAVAMLLLITWKHRGNVVNLLAGTEHRFEKARVIGRWLDQWRGRWRGR